MRLLVTIDLKHADIALFEQYEAIVLPHLSKYGATVEHRLRATDNSTEIHLLSFPDVEAYEAYLADSDRVQARSLWEESGARASGIEVQSLV